MPGSLSTPPRRCKLQPRHDRKTRTASPCRIVKVGSDAGWMLQFLRNRKNRKNRK